MMHCVNTSQPGLETNLSEGCSSANWHPTFINITNTEKQPEKHKTCLPAPKQMSLPVKGDHSYFQEGHKTKIE